MTDLETSALQPMPVKADALNQLIGDVEKLRDFPVETLRALQEMKNAEEDRQALAEFDAAFFRVQSGMTPVIKLGHNKETKSYYAYAEDVMRMLFPLLTENGFGHRVSTKPCSKEGDWSTFVLRLKHAGGHGESYDFDVPLDDHGPKGAKNKPGTQAQVSSSTYARRALYCMVFAVPLGEDKDGNATAVTVTNSASHRTANHDGPATGRDSKAKVGKWLAVGRRSHRSRTLQRSTIRTPSGCSKGLCQGHDRLVRHKAEFSSCTNSGAIAQTLTCESLETSFTISQTNEGAIGLQNGIGNPRQKASIYEYRQRVEVARSYALSVERDTRPPRTDYRERGVAKAQLRS